MLITPEMKTILDNLLAKSVLPSTEQIAAARDERSKVQQHMAELQAHAAKLDQYIDWATRFVASKEKKKTRNFKITKEVRAHSGSWVETVWSVLKDSKEPMTYAEVKEAVAKVREMDGRAGWISAIQRLKNTKHLVIYKGIVGLPEVMERYQADIKAGKIKQRRIRPEVPCPWDNFILTFMASRNDVSVLEMVEAAKDVPDLAGRLERNPYQVYVALRRLVADGKVEKTGKMYRLTDVGRAIQTNGTGHKETQEIPTAGNPQEDLALDTRH
jgi:hypothetical protein